MKKYIFVVLILLSFFFPQAVHANAPTLDDYWLGKARWQYLRSFTTNGTGWTSGFNAGTRMVVVGNAWYLFTRKVNWSDKPSYCSTSTVITMDTEVRKSTDQGRTWSASVTVVATQAGKPWECAATDGGVYYNSTENKWHYIFQCAARDGIWNGCYLERQGIDPMGAFTENVTNPVIHNGDLWSRICTNGTNCAAISSGKRVGDEGTFDIFNYDGTYYYVGFHDMIVFMVFEGLLKPKILLIG